MEILYAMHARNQEIKSSRDSVSSKRKDVSYAICMSIDHRICYHCDDTQIQNAVKRKMVVKSDTNTKLILFFIHVLTKRT